MLSEDTNSSMVLGVSARQRGLRSPLWVIVGSMLLLTYWVVYLGPARSMVTNTVVPEARARYTPAQRSQAPAARGTGWACEQKLRRILEQPAAPGAPAFDAARQEMLFRVKAEPVIFVAEPSYREEAPHYRVLTLRNKLKRSHPFTALKEMVTHFSNFHQEAREVLLKDGYLYADSPEMAYALATFVQPRHLFGHDEIWIERGERLLRARRNEEGRFDYASGPMSGKPARLYPFDWVGAEKPTGPRLHRDLRGVKYRLGFDRMRLRQVTREHVVADLRYGSWWVPSVLKSDGARLDLECEVAGASVRREVEDYRDAALRRQRAVQVLRSTILEQVDEGLPFDEPRREYGLQLDGRLRKNWEVAYGRRKLLYDFNGSDYAVFDEQGRPYVPQVCVDFLIDTLERSCGTWWPNRSTPGKLERKIGSLDFDQFVDRDLLRQVPTFIEFTREHNEWFEVYDTPWNKRVRMGTHPTFMEYLAEYADEFQSGDIVMIRGKTPWDAIYQHYHSFYVYETDPLTGMPLYIAGNAGTPSIRAWYTEAQRTPDRRIMHRIRLRPDWLQPLLSEERDPIEGPPPLGPGRG